MLWCILYVWPCGAYFCCYKGYSVWINFEMLQISDPDEGKRIDNNCGTSECCIRVGAQTSHRIKWNIKYLQDFSDRTLYRPYKCINRRRRNVWHCPFNSKTIPRCPTLLQKQYVVMLRSYNRQGGSFIFWIQEWYKLHCIIPGSLVTLDMYCCCAICSYMYPEHKMLA